MVSTASLARGIYSAHILGVNNAALAASPLGFDLPRCAARAAGAMNDNGRRTGTSLDVWFYVCAAFAQPGGARFFDADDAPPPRRRLAGQLPREPRGPRLGCAGSPRSLRPARRAQRAARG
jgi:hypothetical protein